MSTKETSALQVCEAIGTLARALHALNKFPTSEHQQFGALLSCPATQEQLCLPEPSSALTVFAKHLRSVARDMPGIAPAVGEIVSSLSSST